MKQLRLFEIQQLSLSEEHAKLWVELSSLKEPARKGTKQHKAWQAQKEKLLAELAKVEREMESEKK